MKVTEVNWQLEQAALSEIRKSVFIDEQQVPPELEWDGEDDHAFHWLAYDDNDQLAGTVRMLRNGHIGRMAVLPYYRHQGLGSALLRAAIAKARQLDLREVMLHAQVHALDFYRRQGFTEYGPEFMDANIPHMAMSLPLREEHKLAVDAGKFSVSDPQQTALSLARQSRHALRLLTRSLEPEFYDTDEFSEALSQLARLQRNSEIRLLITDAALINYGHRVLRLQRRLSSAIKVRLIDEETATIAENFLVADLSGLMVMNRNESEDCWADFNCRPLAKEYSARFDELWNLASEDPNLRPLMI